MRVLQAAWAYRRFVLTSIQNEIRSRFARSKLGFAWLILQPLAQVVVFATILSGVLAARLPGVTSKFGYAIYLLAGMLCWNLFSEILSRSVVIFIENASIMKKINFPKITLPIILVGGILVGNVLLALIVLIGIPLLGGTLTVHLVWLPLLMAITIAFATSLGLIVGTFNVFFRDTGPVIGVILQFWYWMTPIAYPIQIVPARFQGYFKLNPLTVLVQAYHDVILYGRAPQWQGLLMLGMASGLLFIAALGIFRRASAEMVDAL